MGPKQDRPDPVEIASRVRRSLAEESRSEVERAVQEALRAFRSGAGADESVERGRRTLEEEID